MPLDLKYGSRLIAAVKNELTFFAFLFFFVTAFFIAVVEARRLQQPIVIWAFLLIVALLALPVLLRFVYAARRSYVEEIQVNTSFARVLGEEIYRILEGPLQNLPKGDHRLKFYADLVEAVPKSKHFNSAAQRAFSFALVEIIEERGKSAEPLLNRKKRTPRKHPEQI